MSNEWIIPTLIALPLVSATLPLLSRYIRGFSARNTATGIMAIEAVLAGLLASSVYTGGRIIYNIGGAALSRPESFAVGIELMADQMSIILIGLAPLVGLAVLSLTKQMEDHKDPFYSAYLLLMGGLMGIFLTHDIFTLFVFLEITGLATYALVSSNSSKESAAAALKYLFVGTVGASIYIIGVGYIYLSTGTLNMTDLAQVLAGQGFIDGAIYGNPLVRAGFGFMTVGLMVKSAIFPLHTWQPEAYSEASDDVTAYIAALVSTAGAYALGRLIFTVFTPRFFAVNPIAAEIIIAMAGISIAAGSILAVMQTDIKRLLAYSSVSQFGLIIAAFGIAAHPAGNSTALIGGLIHLAGHGIMKAGLFIGVGIMASTYGVREIKDYAGLGKKFPVGAAAIAALCVSLIGIPPTIGFLGKWYIALGAVESGLWPIAALIIFSTMLTLLYSAKIIETLYFKESGTKINANIQNPITIAAIVLILIAITAAIAGLVGEPLYDILKLFTTEVYNQ